MEIIKYFPFVREVKPISDAKAELMQDIKEVVENLNMVKAGKLEARPIKELLDEL